MTKIQFDGVTKISVGNPIYNMQGYQREFIIETANGENLSLTLYGKTIGDLSIVNQSPHEALADLLDRYSQLEATIAELRTRQSQAQPAGSMVSCLGCGKEPHMCMCTSSTCQDMTPF